LNNKRIDKGEFLVHYKSVDSSLLNRKNIITFLIISILLLAIPLGLKLLQEQQKLRSRAEGGPIAFQGINVSEINGRQVFKLDDQGQPTVGLTLTSPFGEGSSIVSPTIVPGNNSNPVSNPTSQPSASSIFSSGQNGIGGKVFLDNDKNGLFSSGDQAITDTNVVLRKVGATGDVLLPSGRTDQNGDYIINLTNVPAGNYMVSATLPSGLTGSSAYHHNGPVSGNTVSATIVHIPITPL